MTDFNSIKCSIDSLRSELLNIQTIISNFLNQEDDSILSLLLQPNSPIKKSSPTTTKPTKKSSKISKINSWYDPSTPASEIDINSRLVSLNYEEFNSDNDNLLILNQLMELLLDRILFLVALKCKVSSFSGPTRLFQEFSSVEIKSQKAVSASPANNKAVTFESDSVASSKTTTIKTTTNKSSQTNFIAPALKLKFLREIILRLSNHLDLKSSTSKLPNSVLSTNNIPEQEKIEQLLLEFLIRDLVSIETLVKNLKEKKEKADAKVVDLSNKNKILTDEFKDLKKTSDKNLSAAINNLHSKELAFSEKLNALSQESETKYQQLNKEISSLKMDKNNYQGQNIELKNEILVVRSQLQTLRDQDLKKLQNQLDKEKNEKFQLSTSYELLKNENEKILKVEIENLKAKLSKVVESSTKSDQINNKRISSLETENKKLELENSDLKNNKLNILENEKNILEQNLKTMQTITLNDLQDKLLTQTNQVKVQKSEISDLQDQLQISEDILLEKEQELIDLNNKSEKLKLKIEEISEENRTILGLLDQSKEDYDSLHKNYSQLVLVNESLSKVSRAGSIPSQAQKDSLNRNNLPANKINREQYFGSGDRSWSRNSSRSTNSTLINENLSNYVKPSNLAMEYVKPVILADTKVRPSKASSVYSDKLMPKGNLPENYLNAMKNMRSRPSSGVSNVNWT